MEERSRRLSVPSFGKEGTFLYLCLGEQIPDNILYLFRSCRSLRFFIGGTCPVHGCLLLVQRSWEARFRALSLSLWEPEVLFCPVGDMGLISGGLSLISGMLGCVRVLGRWLVSSARPGDNP